MRGTSDHGALDLAALSVYTPTHTIEIMALHFLPLPTIFTPRKVNLSLITHYFVSSMTGF